MRNAPRAPLAILLAGAVGASVSLHFLAAAARVLTVLILAYAVLRHQALGIDAKLRFGISKGTLARILVAAFFVASEAAQQFFGDAAGSAYAGIGAAGLLVFGIAPLQRLADRIAHHAVPVAPSRAAVADGASAAAIYRRQIELARTDGRIALNERMMLRELRASLGVDAAEADAIGSDVERAQIARAGVAP